MDVCLSGQTPEEGPTQNQSSLLQFPSQINKAELRIPTWQQKQNSELVHTVGVCVIRDMVPVNLVGLQQ